MALPLVLGLLLGLEALTALVAFHGWRVRQRVVLARDALRVRAALVEAAGVARWGGPEAGCAASGLAARDGRSVGGVPFTIRWMPLDTSLVRVALEAAVERMRIRSTAVFLVRREPDCAVIPVPPLPPPL
ncbi:MAG: hypothetical protein RL139_269 [Gemmatimonadota bacterium]|jgi:hypothetical protein